MDTNLHKAFKGEKTRIEIQTPKDGPVAVDAESMSGLAVHKSHKARGYTVTHVRSGLAAFHARTKNEARFAAVLALNTVGDFDCDASDFSPEQQEQTVAIQKMLDNDEIKKRIVRPKRTPVSAAAVFAKINGKPLTDLDFVEDVVAQDRDKALKRAAGFVGTRPERSSILCEQDRMVATDGPSLVIVPCDSEDWTDTQRNKDGSLFDDASFPFPPYQQLFDMRLQGSANVDVRRLRDIIKAANKTVTLETHSGTLMLSTVDKTDGERCSACVGYADGDAGICLDTARLKRVLVRAKDELRFSFFDGVVGIDRTDGERHLIAGIRL